MSKFDKAISKNKEKIKKNKNMQTIKNFKNLFCIIFILFMHYIIILI